jgi:hypothetical protein
MYDSNWLRRLVKGAQFMILDGIINNQIIEISSEE